MNELKSKKDQIKRLQAEVESMEKDLHIQKKVSKIE